MGLAGSGATDGVAMAHYELHAWCLLVLGWMMVPFYMRSRVFTMPEFLERRFSPANRWLLSLISLVAYVLTKIAVGIFAGGVVFSVLLPELSLGPLDSFWLGSILVIVLTGAYTVVGGLRAVAYTEAMQTVVLILGSVLVTAFGLHAVGRLERTAHRVRQRDVQSLEAAGARRRRWHLGTRETSGADGLVLQRQLPLVGHGVMCAGRRPMVLVHRSVHRTTSTGAPKRATGPSRQHFRRVLKLLPVFIFIIPGMICFALVASGKSEALSRVMLDQHGQLIRDEAQKAFPLLVATVLPMGVRGIVVAGLLAALMSSLAGVFNASATLFTMDFYGRMRPHTSQHRLVWIGRLATTAMVLIGLAWIPVIQGGKGLYDYLQGVQAYLAPPIFVVFFLGVFWKRLNGTGCLASLVVGFLLGIFRLAVDTPVKLHWFGVDTAGKAIGYAEGSLFWIINNIFFQYYSVLILVVCCVTMVIASYATAAPDYEKISGLTFGTMNDEQRRQTRGSWGIGDLVASVAVLALILGAYLYFRG